VDKPEARKVDVHPDWTAFPVHEPTDRFLVGYGLDWMERFRGLPFIGTIPRPAPR
jgi:hypoxanthine phosphoribosyltransferase